MSVESLQIDTALAAGKGLAGPQATKNATAAGKAAQEFEAVFINEFLGSMFSGLSTDSMFGGGTGEQVFRSLLLDEYAKNLAGQGGFGIADQVKRELLRTQEAER